ncbi:TraM recognition domain-containing protein [Rothia sp. AR01]|uniref:TraM recognition domain-containing protein n=1 Tax=Rothia santali TaxID=2949643 RepID=A0A9X2HCG4_9MICC|nr:TraM recognition domain-containing protein [Rothia santali]MCP3425172.1 TraM recognition domain-containing protein [Rothia santali]
METAAKFAVFFVFAGVIGGIYAAATLTARVATGTWEKNVFDLAGLYSAGTAEMGVLFWTILILCVLIGIGLAVVSYLVGVKTSGGRGSSDKQALPHRATYKDVKDTLSYDAALKSAREPLKNIMIDPSKPKEERKRLEKVVDEIPPQMLVTELGIAQGKKLYGQSEESKLIYAIPRSGKTAYLAAGWVIDAPGAVITTSTKADILDITAAPREQKGGLAWAFDLMGISGWHRKAMWNPVVGSEDIEVALRRGKAWGSAQPMKGVKGGDWFNSRAGNILGRMLFTAAISDKSMEDVKQWGNNLMDPEPVELLRQHQTVPGARDALSYLQGMQSGDNGEGNFAVQSALSELLEPLALPRVMEQLTCRAEDAFDIAAFLSSHDTLILLADPSENNGAGPITSMFASEVLDEAKRQAISRPGGRFWPPFRAVLDEAANLAAFPKMGSLVTDSGGRGIELSVFVQEASQLKDRWGDAQAKEIANAANVKYYFPGMGVTDETRELSDLMDTYDRKTRSTTSQANGGRSVQVGTQKEQVMTPKQINEIAKGTAILRYANLTPLQVKLTGYWQREDGKEIQRMRSETARNCGRPADLEAIDWSL